jgi:hypothetical protein
MVAPIAAKKIHSQNIMDALLSKAEALGVFGTIPLLVSKQSSVRMQRHTHGKIQANLTDEISALDSICDVIGRR